MKRMLLTSITFSLLAMPLILLSTSPAHAEVNKSACEARSECQYTSEEATPNEDSDPQSVPAQCFCGEYSSRNEADAELMEVQAAGVGVHNGDCTTQWIGSDTVGRYPGRYWVRCE